MTNKLVIQWKNLSTIKNGRLWETATETFKSKSIEKAQVTLSKRVKSNMLFAKYFNSFGDSTVLIGNS